MKITTLLGNRLDLRKELSEDIVVAICISNLLGSTMMKASFAAISCLATTADPKLFMNVLFVVLSCRALAASISVELYFLFSYVTNLHQ